MRMRGAPADTMAEGCVLTGVLLKSFEDLELPLVSPEAAAAFLIKLAMTSAASEAATPLGSFSTILLRYSRYTESNPPTLDEVAGVVISEVEAGDWVLSDSDLRLSAEEELEVVGIKGGMGPGAPPPAAAAAATPGKEPNEAIARAGFMKGEVAEATPACADIDAI